MGVVHPNSFCQVLAETHKTPEGQTQLTEYYYGSKPSPVYISKPASCCRACKGRVLLLPLHAVCASCMGLSHATRRSM